MTWNTGEVAILNMLVELVSKQEGKSIQQSEIDDLNKIIEYAPLEKDK